MDIKEEQKEEQSKEITYQEAMSEIIGKSYYLLMDSDTETFMKYAPVVVKMMIDYLQF